MNYRFLLNFTFFVFILFSLFSNASEILDKTGYEQNNFGRFFLLGDSAPEEKQATNKKVQSAQIKRKDDALYELAIKSIRAVCDLVLKKDLSYFDATDGANQCHLNTLLVSDFAGDKDFLEFCEDLQKTDNQELIRSLNIADDENKDRLRLLSLSMLRYVPRRVREHTFDDLAKRINVDKYTKTLLKNSQQFQRAGRQIGISICQELANIRLKLLQKTLNNHPEIKDQIRKRGFAIPDNLDQICYEAKLRRVGSDTIKTIPKLLSLMLFCDIYPVLFKDNSVYTQFICDGSTLGYADSSLEKFFTELPSNDVPLITILLTSHSDKTPIVNKKTGLLDTFSSRDIILMGGAYFVKYYQPEGIDLSKKYINNFDQLLQKYLDVQEKLQLQILHFAPKWK